MAFYASFCVFMNFIVSKLSDMLKESLFVLFLYLLIVNVIPGTPLFVFHMLGTLRKIKTH